MQLIKWEVCSHFTVFLDVGGGEERRGGKRVHIANVNNAVVNEWWLKSANSSARPPSQAQVRGHSKLVSFSWDFFS